jgi:endonuclease-3
LRAEGARRGVPSDAGVNKATPALFTAADTPEKMAALGEKRVRDYIKTIGLFRTKAKNVVALSKKLVEEHGGQVPRSREALEALPGVGRKTANLVVTMGYGKPGICVDTHVHRISNRLGYVRTRTPEETEVALRAKLPRRYWIGYNDLLVSFGQNVCAPISPRCSVCPVKPLCRRVGVTTSR